MQLRLGGDAPYQSDDPNHTTPTHRRKGEKEKTVEDKNGESNSGKQRGIDPALKTNQSNTIEYVVTKKIPWRY